jgi:hypothetical protein
MTRALRTGIISFVLIPRRGILHELPRAKDCYRHRTVEGYEREQINCRSRGV